jgi:hypothetical protein
MPAPYSYDLWLKREKETGDYEAIANKQGRHSKIKDEKKFKLFVKENNGKTQTIMAELWGENITHWTLDKKKVREDTSANYPNKQDESSSVR